MLVPKSKLGVAVVANLTGTQMPEATCYSIVDLLLGLPKKDWNAAISEEARKFDAEQSREYMERIGKRRSNTKPSHDLAAYSGVYEDPAYGQAKVALDDNKLLVVWSNFKSKLDHFHYDTFIATEDALKAETAAFQVGADGEVSGMNFLGVNFKKVRAKAAAQVSGQ
jgi:hypothetical protein